MEIALNEKQEEALRQLARKQGRTVEEVVAALIAAALLRLEAVTGELVP